MDTQKLWSRVRAEMDAASDARHAGLEGRARVSARRAAALAIHGCMLEPDTQPGLNVLSILNEFCSQPHPVQVIDAVRHLLLRVDQDYQLPEGIDVIADAETVIAYCFEQKGIFTK